ncbi:MAG: efflux RND transporter periplasmic adaptor subunit, partial [Acidobacteria bacterium]|nr:efflux RND transporter periplasmic adaptor subunit [Acidobacteriota bacterium]
SGLESGDSVLLGANFLVDSESRLKSAINAMTATTSAPAASPAAGHAH